MKQKYDPTNLSNRNQNIRPGFRQADSKGMDMLTV
jgi:hypothetical protein